MADDDKKRTQEASETNFTTRGGRQDETSGAGKPGKPHTSPCKRGPGTMGAPAAPPADHDAATVVGPPLPASSLPGDVIERILTALEYRYRHNELDANVEHSYGSTTARRAQVWAADDSGDLVDMYDEAIDFHLTKVAGKLAQLNWT